MRHYIKLIKYKTVSSSLSKVFICHPKWVYLLLRSLISGSQYYYLSLESSVVIAFANIWDILVHIYRTYISTSIPAMSLSPFLLQFVTHLSSYLENTVITAPFRTVSSLRIDTHFYKTIVPSTKVLWTVITRCFLK